MHVLDVPKSTATRSVIHTPGNHRGPRPDGRGSAGEVRPPYERTGRSVARDHTIDGIRARRDGVAWAGRLRGGCGWVEAGWVAEEGAAGSGKWQRRYWRPRYGRAPRSESCGLEVGGPVGGRAMKMRAAEATRRLCQEGAGERRRTIGEKVRCGVIRTAIDGKGAPGKRHGRVALKTRARHHSRAPTGGKVATASGPYHGQRSSGPTNRPQHPTHAKRPASASSPTQPTPIANPQPHPLPRPARPEQPQHHISGGIHPT
jgi:hypothetical protein